MRALPSLHDPIGHDRARAWLAPRWVWLGAALAIAIAPFSATAAPPTTARELAAAAANKARAAEFDDAIELYEAAFAQDPSPVLLLNIAVILDRQGRVFDAIQAYERHLSFESDPVGRLSSTKRLAAVRVGAPGRVVVTGAPPGAEVFIDDVRVGRVPKATADLPAGDHSLRISHSGYVTFSSTIVVSPGVKQTVEAALAPVQVAAPADVPEPIPLAETEDDDDSRTMWIWIGVGTAIAVGTALTLGLVYGLDDGGSNTVAPRPADRTWSLKGELR